MKPKLITPPEADPVTLQEVKEHLRVAWFNDDDEYLKGLIKAAVSHLDGYQGILNRCIMPQAWLVTRSTWCRSIDTPFTDTTAAVVKYRDVTGTEQTLPDTAVRISADQVEFLQFPELQAGHSDAISIVTTHGYEIVPESLKLAIKILVAHYYRNREPVTFGGVPAKIPHSVDALIAPHRWAF